MIQRIQSIFLLLASAAGFGLFGLPFATTSKTVAESTLFSDAVYNLNDHVALLSLFAAAGGLALIAIFLFKNRPLQLNLTRLSIVANVVGLVIAVVFIMQDGANLNGIEPNDGLGAYLPFAFLLFAILALRAIGKDEKLVKSMDRLR